MTAKKPSPYELWKEAGADRERYRALLRERGLLIPREPGDDSPALPCGWPVKVPEGTGDIHDAIGRWHEGDGYGLELHDYLGMTWDEYSLWAATGRLPKGSRFATADRDKINAIRELLDHADREQLLVVSVARLRQIVDGKP